MKIGVMLVFCFILMTFVLLKTINEKSIAYKSKKYFIISICFALIMLVTDGFSILFKDGTIKTTVPVNYFVQITYFISASICCYFDFLLIDSLGGIELVKEKKLKLILSIPLYFYGIIVFTSIWTGWLFTINPETNEYVRGPLNFFQFIFCYGYIFAALIISLVKYLKGSLDPNRDTYFTNLLFCIIPTFGGIFQFAISVAFDVELPLISAGLALSTVIIFVEMIQNQVSIDSLTGLFSRKAFYKYLYNINKSSVTHLFVYMIDLDKFKNINDSYGHLEGDHALVLFAQALRNHTRKGRGIAARIGGDEFAIVVELANNSPLDYLNAFKEELTNVVDDAKIDYKIEASIGFAELNEKDTIKELIQRADDEMYKEKLQK